MSAKEKDPLFAAAAYEAERIHTENKKHSHYVPPAEKKIVCHIIDPNILPAAQETILNRLETKMRPRDYTEKVVCLKKYSSGGFARSLAETMADKRAECERVYGKGVTVEFDVACAGTAQVEEVYGIDPKMRALAFAAAETGIDVNGVQVEGIVLALRALRKNDLTALRRIYDFLGGGELPAEALEAIQKNDIAAFCRAAVFSLPVIRLDGRKMKDMNDIIRDNILSAA